MRNDARPIGEEFRDIAEHDRERSAERTPQQREAPQPARNENTQFVVNRDPGDEETSPDASER